MHCEQHHLMVGRSPTFVSSVPTVLAGKDQSGSGEAAIYAAATIQRESFSQAGSPPCPWGFSWGEQSRR